MAFDAFFKLEGGNAGEIKGESMDRDFKGWIEPISFQLGVENTVNIGSASGGAGTGKADFQNLVIEKAPDATSPILFLACCSGAHYDKGTLALRKTGTTAAKAGEPYMTFEFKLVLVESIENNGTSGDDVPTESLVLQFGAMNWIYRSQDKSGKLGAPLNKSWSRVLNDNTFEVE